MMTPKCICIVTWTFSVVQDWLTMSHCLLESCFVIYLEQKTQWNETSGSPDEIQVEWL